MRNVIIAVLAVALAASWAWFLTAERGRVALQRDRTAPVDIEDTVTVWVNELVGSPDEAYYYELQDLWNASHPNVKMKMCVMSHAGYQSKLRVAIASGQPPDVCMGGLETLEGLKYSGKSADLAVPIPRDLFPDEELDRMGRVVKETIMRDGRPTVFPIWRCSYGGVILANRQMLEEAGFDDEQIRRQGWTFDQFRETCRRMTRDTDGDGVADTWGFGAARVHFQHLFLNEFGPGVWGREIARENFIKKDEATGAWTIDPALTEDHIYETFLLFHQLLNEDKVWDPATLGMNWNEIIDEVVVRRRIGMIFGETPWVAKLRREIWEADKAMGANVESAAGGPPDLTVIWMPTLKAGDYPAPRASVMGFSVLKQLPYKGDAHTENALRVAQFLTHPVHLARSQLRRFRHLPPDPIRFGAIYPELLHSDDPWVKFYNEIMDSDLPLVGPVLSQSDPSLPQYLRLRSDIDQWLEKEGIGFLEQIAYKKITPHEGAHRFYEALKAVGEHREQ
jgi:ABC-type glycerol-3-phosphate transport system substrate-binding protein